SCTLHHCCLHSFPTRRSSDLLLIHTDTAQGLEDYIQSGQRRVIPWLEKIPAEVVDFGVHADEHFANINTPADFEAAQSQLTNWRSEEHTSELQSRFDLVCRLL